MSDVRVDLTDMLVAYYPQPKCPACGRFARRGYAKGWEFSCCEWDGKDWWCHNGRKGRG